MTPLLLVSQHVLERHGDALNAILRTAPRALEVLPFTLDLQVTAAQVPRIEAAFFSYEIWNGTIKNQPSAQSALFWSIADNAPHLKWLQVFSAGSDQQRYRYSFERGVRVSTSAGTNGAPVAMTAFTGLLAVARGFPQWVAAQRGRQWTPLQGGQMPRDLRGQTAVIVGTGIIGTTIARCLHAVGVKTVGIRRSAAPAEHFDRTLPLTELDSVLPTADWLVLAGPLTSETRGLIDARRLALLPRGAGLVNVSRGEIVDEAAVIHALRSGHLRGAHLDVFTEEPLPADSPFWDLPNTIITPHNAAISAGNFGRGVELFLRNLAAYLAGRPLINEV
jgi:D-2-hydroxyacid dehydrogenase (NADP+)